MFVKYGEPLLGSMLYNYRPRQQGLNNLDITYTCALHVKIEECSLIRVLHVLIKIYISRLVVNFGLRPLLASLRGPERILEFGLCR